MKRKNKVWSISTEALNEKGYIRLFDVYEDRLEVYGYSPWTNETYGGPLDRFTIRLKPDNYDVDSDLWRDDLDIMPTHTSVPNAIIASAGLTTAILAHWMKERRLCGPKAVDTTPRQNLSSCFVDWSIWHRVCRVLIRELDGCLLRSGNRQPQIRRNESGGC